MRFITDLKFLSFILSLSIAAPIAQDLESVPAGNQIDNGIDSSSNGLSTGQPNLAIRIGNNNPVLTLDALGSSSLGVAADNEFLMAARRQRPENRRYRPPQPPPSKGSIPLEDNCQPGSDGPNCQPETKSTPIPVGEQSDTPDPLLDDAPEAAGGALSTWGLWNLLNNPNTPLPH